MDAKLTLFGPSCEASAIMFLNLGSDSESKAIVLRGPAGFILKQDCAVDSLDLTAAASAVRAPVTSCQAELNIARLAVADPGLKAGLLYAIGMEVLTNPPGTPVRNLWSLEVGTEASSPFPGFAVQTFPLLALQALTCARGFVWPSPLANLVNLTFQPQTSQSLEGHGHALTIRSPPGVTFSDGVDGAVLTPYSEAEVREHCIHLCSSGGCEWSLQAPNVLVINLREAPNALLKGVQYCLRLRVVALSEPQGTWKLESYEDLGAGKKLDTGEILSFQLCDSLAHLAIGRYDPGAGGLTEPNQDAEALLPDLLVSMTCRHAVLPDDWLQIQLPPGYLTDCSEVGWLQGSLPGITPDWLNARMPANVELACTSGEVLFHVLPASTEALPAGEMLTLRFAVANPRRSFGEQYWQVRHLRQGEVLEAGAWRSWEVIKQLSEVSITLASAAVGQRSSVVGVSFRAAGDAELLKLESTWPLQLDFSSAYVSRGRLQRSESSLVLLVSLDMQDRELLDLRVYNVQLPNVGGRCIFHLETQSRTGSRVARKRSIDTGTKIPGHITLGAPNLRSEYAPNLTQSLWPIQLGGRAVLEMDVSFPEGSGPNETLRMSCQPFTVLQGNFRLVSVETGRIVPLSFEKTGDGTRLEMVAGEGLHQDVPYRVVTVVLAPETLQRRVVCSLEVGAAGLPLSWGSAEADVQLVPSYQVEVTSARSPPLAVISIELAASLLASSPSRLALVAPTGFRFTEDCLGGISAMVARCSPTLINEQEAAELVPIKAFFTDVQGLSIQVRTPAKAPSQTPWLLVGWNQGGGVVGWGEDKLGIDVLQMRSVAIMYPASPDTRSELTVRLRLRDELLPGGSLQLLHPPELVLNCSGAQLQEISLPIEGCTAEAGSLALQLSSGLQPGTYAFGVGAKVPRAPPKTNMFSLLVFGSSGLVQDATTAVEGPQLQSELHLGPRPLRWTAAEAGQASSVIVGFEVRQEVKRGLVGSVLITLAENFKHTLETPHGIEILNPSLALSRSHGANAWADIRMADHVLIHLDLAQALLPGDYDFRIPITVPEELAAFNVWQVTLCKPGGTAEPCTAESARALLTFPAAGFSLTSQMPAPQTGCGARLSVQAFGCLLVLFML
ncbi:unnamed protein product [Symbiodinium natans]|uniref:Uncharacterized protein n=1 Tax=Symbiodinium natans TaxID=878477 RepID=A0A812RY25_9DINO|nr:unnamed protein product [Symbiodinium natans]